MKKLILSIIVLVLLVMPISGWASDFADMPNDWSTEALEKAVENGLLKGTDGKIMPNENLTRAQMAAVVNRSFGAYQEASLEDFKDVDPSQWYYSEMAKALNMKTFQGNNNMLNPNDSITREQAFAVMARALKVEPVMEKPEGFVDLDQVSTWAKGEVYAMIEGGYIQGSNNMIHPQGYVTRAEFAKLMDNMIKGYISQAGEYTSLVDGNIMINVKDVILKDLTLKGDLIIGDGVGDGDLTLDKVEIGGRLVIRGGGENSIIIKGNSKIKNIVVARVNGKVRVYNESGAEIGQVLVDGSDDITLEGQFDSVKLKADNVIVTAKKATIKEASVEGVSSKIVVDDGSKIDKIVVTGKNTIIEGKGKVTEVLANADDIVVSVIDTKVTAGQGTSGVMAGETKVEIGKTETVKEEEKPSRPSGTSSLELLNASLKTGDNDPVGATISGKNINVILPVSVSELEYKVTAGYNKPVKVQSVMYVKGDSKTDVTSLLGGLVNFNSTVSKDLVATFNKKVVDAHFAFYGDEDAVVVEVTVLDGTSPHTYTITVRKQVG